MTGPSDQLKTAIVELRIPPGEPLREADIAQGLSVSKTPAREAREHAQIYEAIERRDPEAAERFMRQHIRSVRDDQLRALPGRDTER